ncbi:hypothetical protein CR513_59224, partial [Mucuna pruriens]
MNKLIQHDFGRFYLSNKYSQEHGIDYNEVFEPISRTDIVRMIFQLDVKVVFLHGTLSEDVYVEQSKGYEKKGSGHMVYKLHKAFYGLKQALQAWFSQIESYVVYNKVKMRQHFKWSKEGKVLIFSAYVDDLTYIRNDELIMTNIKESMQKEINMAYLENIRFFLRIEVLQCSYGIYI